MIEAEVLDAHVINPKADGYRAIHVVVMRDDRHVEIQLRTHWLHQWAQAVESLDLVHGHGLKEGGGPQVLRDLLALSAYAVAETAAGRTMPRSSMRSSTGCAPRQRPT